MRRGFLIIILFCIGVFLCVLPLPYIEITSGHEAREGIRLRAMVSSGDWLFSDVLRKPPLYYWLSGLIAGVRGGMVDAIALRLPSGVLGVFSTVLLAQTGGRMVTPKGALWAGFLLLTAPLHLQQSHSGRTDMTLCFFVTASLLLFFFISEQAGRQGQRKTRTGYLFAGALACAFLSKGPIGVILVALPIGGFLLWRRDGRGLHTLFQPGPFFLFALLVGGWCALAWWDAGEEFWRTQVLEENVARFAGEIERMSPFYYLGPLLGGFAPWSVLLPFALWRAIKDRKQEPGPFFLALWWITTVLFFQFAAYKRARYLLPTLPPAALLVGWWISVHLPTVLMPIPAKPWWRLVLIGFSLLVGLTIVTGVALLCGIQGVGPLSCRVLERAPGPEVAPYAEVYCAWLVEHFGLSFLWLGAFALCLGFFLRLLWLQRWEQALVLLLGALVLVYAGVYPSWLITTGKAASPHAYTQLLLERLGNEQAIAFINPYDEKGVPVLFALQDHLPLKDVQWPWGAPQPRLPSGYYLVTENRKKELVSNATGTWTEVLHDIGATQWPILLFFYSASEK